MNVLSPGRLRPVVGPRASLVGGRLVAAGVSAVWMVAAARLLAIGEFADLALASALSAMAVQVADLGVGIQLPQAFAGPGGEMPSLAIAQALRRRLTGAAVATPLLIGAFVVVAADPSLWVALGFGVSTIATAVYGAGYVALRAVDANRLETVLEPGGRLVVLVLGTGIAAGGHGLAWIAWAYAMADVACLLAVTTVLRRRTGAGGEGGPGLDRATWVSAAAPIGMIYWRADIWLLAALATSRQVALYGSAYRLLDAALLPALVISQLFPAPFARCGAAGRPAMVRRWLRGSALVMVPFTVVAVAVGRPLLGLLFGADYGGGAAALALLGIAAPLTAAAFLLTMCLATLDPRAYIGVALVALAANVAANLVLARTYGAAGAAAATVASQALLVGWLRGEVNRRLAPG